MDSGSIPEVEISSLAQIRQNLNSKFKETGEDMKRNGGVNLLKGEDKEALKNLFEKLVDYGLFVVPNGELESWLSELNVTGRGPNWLIKVFEKMGEDSQSGSYLMPKDGDVWDFIENIARWFDNVKRKGIPN